MSYTEDAKELLSEHQVKVSVGRFPYTYCYDWLRTQIFAKTNLELSRSWCAHRTEEVCARHGVSKDRFCIAGALIYLLYYEPTMATALAADRVADLFQWAMGTIWIVGDLMPDKDLQPEVR